MIMPVIVYYIIRSFSFLYVRLTMMWSNAYCFGVTVHQILAELWPFENFCKFFISG